MSERNNPRRHAITDLGRKRGTDTTSAHFSGNGTTAQDPPPAKRVPQKQIVPFYPSRHTPLCRHPPAWQTTACTHSPTYAAELPAGSSILFSAARQPESRVQAVVPAGCPSCAWLASHLTANQTVAIALSTYPTSTAYRQHQDILLAHNKSWNVRVCARTGLCMLSDGVRLHKQELLSSKIIKALNSVLNTESNNPHHLHNIKYLME